MNERDKKNLIAFTCIGLIVLFAITLLTFACFYGEEPEKFPARFKIVGEIVIQDHKDGYGINPAQI